MLITHSKFKAKIYIPLPKDISNLKNLSFEKVYLKEEVREYAKNNSEKMFDLPEIMANSQKDLQNHINDLIANTYVEFFEQNVQKLRDGTDSTLLYKTDCFLGNHLPHLRDTLTRKNRLNMSMEQLGSMRDQEFEHVGRHAARKVVDSDSLSSDESHITRAEALHILSQSEIDAEPHGLSQIGKSGYIDDDLYDTEIRDRRVSNMNLNAYNENQDISSGDEEPKTALQIYQAGSVHENGRGRDAIMKTRRSRSLSNDRNRAFYGPKVSTREKPKANLVRP